MRTVRQIMRQALRLIVPAKLRAFIHQQLQTRLGEYEPEAYSAERWDEEYEGGSWDYLGHLSELARFSIEWGTARF
jgi:hypothetical protein